MRDGEAFAGTNPMKYTKWLPTAEFADLLIRLREEGVEGRPPSLGLRGSLKTALIRMRHNIVQAVIGEQLGVSQPTVSRAIGVMTGAIILALRDMLLTAEEVPEGCDCRAGRPPLPLLELARSPRTMVAVSTR